MPHDFFIMHKLFLTIYLGVLPLSNFGYRFIGKYLLLICDFNVLTITLLLRLYLSSLRACFISFSKKSFATQINSFSPQIVVKVQSYVELPITGYHFGTRVQQDFTTKQLYKYNWFTFLI